MPASQQQLEERKGFSVHRSESSQPENKLLALGSRAWLGSLCRALPIRSGDYPAWWWVLLFGPNDRKEQRIAWAVPMCCLPP